MSNYIGGATSQAVSLARNGWSTVANWVANKIGGAVSVTVNLLKGWSGTIKKWLGFENGGVMTDKGVLFNAGGGIYSRGIPMYAGGSSNAPSHGSLFVAGENGAEMVGHIGNRTEVMNRFQLAAVMNQAIVNGMSPFTSRMIHQMATCANGVIRSVLVTADTMEAAYATAGGGFNPSGTLAQTVYEDSRRAYENNFSDASLSKSMRDFYTEYVEPTLREIASDTKRQADKEEKTIVQVGNRTITDAVETQQKANGYKFTK